MTVTALLQERGCRLGGEGILPGVEADRDLGKRQEKGFLYLGVSGGWEAWLGLIERLACMVEWQGEGELEFSHFGILFMESFL